MSVKASRAANAVSSLEKQSLPLKRSLVSPPLPIHEPIQVFTGKVDNLMDGVLILTEHQELIYANDNARRVLRRLAHSQDYDDPVPQEIWHICQSLIRSRSLFPHQYWLMESEIFADDSTAVHVRVRWLQLEPYEHPCLMVTIEDRYQALQTIAIEEAQKYGLTPREKEVWLLYRANYSYKQISQELCITPSTVKKHMKSIHVKQKENSNFSKELH